MPPNTTAPLFTLRPARLSANIFASRSIGSLGRRQSPTPASGCPHPSWAVAEPAVHCKPSWTQGSTRTGRSARLTGRGEQTPSGALNRQGADSRRDEQQIRSLSVAAHGPDFVTVTGQILMAVHSCLPGDPDMIVERAFDVYVYSAATHLAVVSVLTSAAAGCTRAQVHVADGSMADAVDAHCRTSPYLIKGRRCAAPGPASAPPLGLGRPARRTPGHHV